MATHNLRNVVIAECYFNYKHDVLRINRIHYRWTDEENGSGRLTRGRGIEQSLNSYPCRMNA